MVDLGGWFWWLELKKAWGLKLWVLWPGLLGDGSEMGA